MKSDLSEKDPIVSYRQMRFDDIETLTHAFCFPWATLKATKEKWEKYYEEQQKNRRTVIVLEKAGALIGYGSYLRFSEYAPFSGIPEIHDVWIDELSRGLGYGTQLILALEELARGAGYKEIGIGVGLYSDYGRAQKLYFHLGYVPDGRGITYKYLSVVAGKSYPIDDDLILWLIKSL